MSDLYDSDVLLWSDTQADLLRRLGAGKQVNAIVDWEHVAEEIEAVGRSQLTQVRSLLVQAMAHVLKARAWPLSRQVAHWLAEARGFCGDAADTFTPSMCQRIDVAELYARAIRRLPETMDGEAPGPVPEECPWTLDELLGGG